MDKLPSEVVDISKDETYELLNIEEKPEETLDLDEPEPKEDEEVKDEDKEEIPVEDELEEELKEPTAEDLELVTPVRRREILAKYPKIFKDFPYLEKAYYREQQFTELLPTIDDAKMAVEKARIMDGFEREVIGEGKLDIVLGAIKEDNEDSFKQVVDNYLPALQKVDEKAYYHVVGNLIRGTIIQMVTEARNMGEPGQPLQAAANILNQFVFGTNTFEAPKTLAKPVQRNDREAELQSREQKFVQQQFESTRDNLQTKVDNVLTSTIEGNIDPRKSMTDYVRKVAVKDASEQLEKMISQDSRFRVILDKLWEKAFEDKFSKAATDRIRAAYLSKAKTLLPTVIKKARNEALKGMGKRVTEDETPPKKGPIPAGRTSAGKVKEAKDIPRGMKSIDFLMQD
jgi:hypothetical protein